MRPGEDSGLVCCTSENLVWKKPGRKRKWKHVAIINDHRRITDTFPSIIFELTDKATERLNKRLTKWVIEAPGVEGTET